MSGPIVRTGTTPKFWENWDKAFGGGDSSKDSGTSKSGGAKAKSKKGGKKKAGRKTKK